MPSLTLPCGVAGGSGDQTLGQALAAALSREVLLVRHRPGWKRSKYDLVVAVVRPEETQWVSFEAQAVPCTSRPLGIAEFPRIESRDGSIANDEGCAHNRLRGLHELENNRCRIAPMRRQDSEADSTLEIFTCRLSLLVTLGAVAHMHRSASALVFMAAPVPKFARSHKWSYDQLDALFEHVLLPAHEAVSRPLDISR